MTRPSPGTREDLRTVLRGGVPAKVPHFELVFQLEQEAFGLRWPGWEEIVKASPAERDRLRERYFSIWEAILDRFGWSAVQIPETLGGFYAGELVREAKDRFGDRALVFDFNGDGTFWMPSGHDMLDFYALFFDSPEEAHALARRKAADSIALARRQAASGADFIVINSDYGFNAGPFLSPEMFAEFVTPYLAEIVAAIHDEGIPAILHSDGDLRKILDQLVSTGIDGYQSIDPQGNMDLAQVKKEYGDRLILMGNVRTALLQEPDEALIRDTVRHCLDVGKPGGRYIFSTSNCIFAGMPLESYEILFDEYCRRA